MRKCWSSSADRLAQVPNALTGHNFRTAPSWILIHHRNTCWNEPCRQISCTYCIGALQVAHKHNTSSRIFTPRESLLLSKFSREDAENLSQGIYAVFRYIPCTSEKRKQWTRASYPTFTLDRVTFGLFVLIILIRLDGKNTRRPFAIRDRSVQPYQIRSVESSISLTLLHIFSLVADNIWSEN